MRPLHSSSTKDHQLLPQWPSSNNNRPPSKILLTTKTRTATITTTASSSLAGNPGTLPKKCSKSRSLKNKMRTFNLKIAMSSSLRISKRPLSSRRTYRSAQKNGIRRSLSGRSSTIVLLPTQVLAISTQQTRRGVPPKMTRASAWRARGLGLTQTTGRAFRA